MKIRFAAALFALALPLCAQDPAAAEALFYKAYWLQNGERNYAEAMTLYDKFLQQAPEHALVSRAAQFQFELLTRAGKTEEAKAFAAKYEKVLGKVSVPAAGAGTTAGEGRGEGRGRGGEGGDAQARLADLKKQLEAAKSSGDEEQAARLERQIRRLEQGGGEAGAGGPGGQGGRGMRGGGMFGSKKLTEMSTEELDQFKEGMERMSGMVERMREANPDGAKTMEENLASMKKALDENKLEDAQKALDKIRESMPRGGRRGGAGGGAGGGEGGGRGAGGGAGRPAGGGGGGNSGGGGGGN